jgi:hypothetical protein
MTYLVPCVELDACTAELAASELAGIVVVVVED